MGRTTWESIPPKFRPLKNRVNFVLSSKMQSTENCTVVQSMAELEEKMTNFEEVWCIGGASVYELLLKSGQIDEIYLTRVKADFDCDAKLASLYDNIKEREIKMFFNLLTKIYHSFSRLEHHFQQ